MDCSPNLLGIKSLDLSNFACIDCSLQTSHVLCEFGCYICASCSKIHSSMGHTVKTQSEELQDYQLKIMQSGGNTALLEFFKYYGLESSGFSNKYYSKAAYFYAEMIKNLANDLNFSQEFPNVSEGKELFEVNQEINLNDSESVIINQPLLDQQVEGSPGVFYKLCKCFLDAAERWYKGNKKIEHIEMKDIEFSEKKESAKSYSGYSSSTTLDKNENSS